MDTPALLNWPTASPRPGLAGSVPPRSTDTGQANTSPADRAGAVTKPFAAVLQSVSAARAATVPSPDAQGDQGGIGTMVCPGGVAESAESEAETEAGQSESGPLGGLIAAGTALPVWTPDSPPPALALMQWMVQVAGAAPGTEPAPQREQAAAQRDAVMRGTLVRGVETPLAGAVDRAGRETTPREGFALPMAEAEAAVPTVEEAVVATGGGGARVPGDGGHLLARAGDEPVSRVEPTVGEAAPPWQLAAVGTPVAQVGAPVVAPAQTWIQTPVTQPGFSDEVVVELVRRVGQSEQGLQTVTLHLNPQALGPVSVSIELSGPAARVDFGVSEALTRQHLEACLPGLAEALRAEGVVLVHGQVHEASPQALAEAAAGASTGSASTGSDARARGDAAMDGQGRSSSGERQDHREAAPVRSTDPAAAGLHPPGVRGSVSGRAGHLDLFA
jgi:flagellar hook-length control protein FliK